MENFEAILLYNFEKYPEMTPQDAMKLCYQSAYGCGHLIKNEEQALSMLKNEMENIEADDGAQLIEPIGNGYARLDLHKAKALGIPAEKICEIFIKSANEGQKGTLLQKIIRLEMLVKINKTPFSAEEFCDFVSGYDCQMISHSEKYRKLYSPAYRVVIEELANGLQ